MNIAYFGSEASNTHIVALQLFENDNLISKATILDCFRAVENGDIEKAVVPLENSIEGTVSTTLDFLYEFEGIKIEAEAVMPITHHLMIHPDNHEIEKIYSHPQALAQCYHFLNNQYKEVIKQEFGSTAAAAKRVAENPEKKYAAIANLYAAKYYNLKVLHTDIQDFEQNHTKFIVISKKEQNLNLNKNKIAEKTSLILTLPEDHAGGLHQVLSVFAWRKMNLTKIESRTLKTGLGNYFFFINIDGNWESVLHKNAIDELKSIGVEVKFLGHYNEYLLEG
jgi:prephenate dehydratase